MIEEGKVLADAINYSRGARGELIVPVANQMEGKFFGSEKGFNMLEDIIGHYKTVEKEEVDKYCTSRPHYPITMVNIIDPVLAAKCLKGMG